MADTNEECFCFIAVELLFVQALIFSKQEMRDDMAMEEFGPFLMWSCVMSA